MPDVTASGGGAILSLLASSSTVNMTSDASSESDVAAVFCQEVNGFNYVSPDIDIDGFTRYLVADAFDMSGFYDGEDDNPHLLLGSYHSKNPADWSWKIYDQYTRNSDALDDLENIFVVPEEDISIEVQATEDWKYESDAVEENQLSAEYNVVNVPDTDGNKDALDEHWRLLRDGRGLKDVSISRGLVIMMVKEIQWSIYLCNFKDSISKLRLLTGTVDSFSEEILDNSDFTPYRILYDRGK